MADVPAILAEIERLYYKASRETILADFARAIDLLKELPDEETRSQAAVYMEGLAEMRSEWRSAQRGGPPKPQPKR